MPGGRIKKGECMIEELFQAIDQKNTETFVRYLHPDAVFRFGNQPAVTGHDAIRDYVSGFLASVKLISHRIDAVWSSEQGMVCHLHAYGWFAVVGTFL